MSSVASLLPALVLLAAPVLAFAAGGADDEAVTTAKAASSPAEAAAAPPPAAPAATRPLTTQEQVDAWLSASPVKTLDDGGPLNLSRPEADGPIKRKVHGAVEVAVGTGGYRHMGVSALFPVGETGTLGVAVAKTDFGRNGGWGYDALGPGGPGYGMGYGMGYDGFGAGPYGYGPYARGGRSQSLALSLDMSGRSDSRCANGARTADAGYVEPVWATQMRGAQRPCDLD